jgi:hypothetical protein
MDVAKALQMHMKVNSRACWQIFIKDSPKSAETMLTS